MIQESVEGSYKMDRKSSFATSLKSAISDKLFHYLGDDFADDVLAEYIVVMVCNGKRKIQAKEDLKDFLSEMTEDFVSWLYDYLSENFDQSRASIKSSVSEGIISPKYPSSGMKISSEVSAGHKNRMQYPYKKQSFVENAYGSYTKLIEKEQQKDPSIVSSEKNHLAAANRRGNVWDRLGQPKPREDNSSHGGQANRSGLTRRNLEAIDINRLTGSEKSNEIYSDSILNVNSNRKRSFGRFDPIRYNNSVFVKPPTVAIDSTPGYMSQKKLIREVIRQVQENDNLTSVPVTSPQVTKSVSIKNDDGIDTDPVKAHILDMKLRLQKMEMEMSKIRPLVTSNDCGKTNSFLSSGSLTFTTEDIDSRTVHVSNVHFAAPNGNITNHFSKCGAVVKVIELNDVTGQPKGEAYVTFADKESADKALELSGTSFWSRILKVVMKTEMPVVTPSPIKRLWNHSYYPIIKQPTFQRRTHMQWKRDKGTSENSISYPLSKEKPETSETIVQQGSELNQSASLSSWMVSSETSDQQGSRPSDQSASFSTWIKTIDQSLPFNLITQ